MSLVLVLEFLGILIGPRCPTCGTHPLHTLIDTEGVHMSVIIDEEGTIEYRIELTRSIGRDEERDTTRTQLGDMGEATLTECRLSDSKDLVYRVGLSVGRHGCGPRELLADGRRRLAKVTIQSLRESGSGGYFRDAIRHIRRRHAEETSNEVDVVSHGESPTEGPRDVDHGNPLESSRHDPGVGNDCASGKAQQGTSVGRSTTEDEDRLPGGDGEGRVTESREILATRLPRETT